jgi:uncharacterized damage-inducible protein DinB
MERREDIQKLIDHELWANRQIVELALSARDLPDRVQEIMSHVLNAQKVWLARLKGESQPVGVWDSVLTENWLEQVEENSKELKSVLENTESLESKITYKNSKGSSFESTVAEIFHHLMLHSQYHRGQLVVLMKPYATSLPATDFIFWSREG